jgi:uncharacterized membrane protein YsdA (DUF1294 family)
MFWVFLLLMSSVTFALYGYDKAQAVRYGNRVPEVVLLTLGFLGGTLGAFAAMRVFRHKTRKGSFLVKFWGLSLLQVGMVIYMPARVEAYIARFVGVFF